MIKELEREMMQLDLKIANRGKDYLIGQIKAERADWFGRLLLANHNIGKPENQLLQLQPSRHL